MVSQIILGDNEHIRFEKWQTKEELEEKIKVNESALDALRQGMFAPKNRGKLLEKTEEGVDISMNLLKKGYLLEEEVENESKEKTQIAVFY